MEGLTERVLTTTGTAAASRRDGSFGYRRDGRVHLADSRPVWTQGTQVWWRVAYRRAVRDSFAAVPLYRERWALDGRTDPVLVLGRLGRDGGAVPAAEVARRVSDLVPLGGGATELDPLRGLGSVLPGLPSGALVVVLATTGVRPPNDLAAGVRGCVLDPDRLPGDESSAALAEVVRRLRHGGAVLAVGTDEQVARLVEALPAGDAAALRHLPVRELDQLDAGPHGLLHDPLLGFLGSFRRCGRWHVDWRRVYVRETGAGLAFTVPRQRSPRLVDVLAAGGVAGRVGRCPRHASPVVLT
jgi:hypothetical protein